MKVLQNILSEKIVSIDIETVRVKENFEDLDDGTQSAWEYKNKQNGEVPDYEELKELWTKNASLYAEFSKVCAVSLAFLHDGQLYCKEFYGEDELEILKALSITFNNMQVQSKDYRLVAHSGRFFDYPYLSKRFIVNGFDIPPLIDSTDSKPWLQTNLCTNELWKVGGTGAGSSLQALCNVLNIPISKVDLVGDAVGKAYYDGELERIGRYCSLDTIATFNVIRRFKKESIFQFDDVQYVFGYSDDVKPTEIEIEQPLLIKLYNLGVFSKEIKSELKELLIEPTEEDKANLKKIIVAHYQKKGDKVAIKKQKEAEIAKFIDNL